MPRNPSNVEPTPPAAHIQYAGHHWLECLNVDMHSFGLRCLQWNPEMQRWSHSGGAATGTYLDTRGWCYVCPQPLPDLSVVIDARETHEKQGSSR